MSKQADDAVRVLRTITKRRTNSIRAAVALVHATLDVAAAVREEKAAVDRQTAVVERLWDKA